MKIKTVVLYRVVQEWRAPVFEKLSDDENLDLEVWHGPDFKGTKVVSTTKPYSFKRRLLFSFKIKMKSRNGLIAMPFSPFLIFSLIFKNPDVVVCEGASNMINSLIAFIYCRIFRKKFIWWSLGKLQNRTYDAKRSAIEKLIEYVEKNSHAIITYSSIGEEYFLALGIPSNRIFKAVNVVDTDGVLNMLSTKSDLRQLESHYRNKYDFIVLFVGALIREKNIDMLLEAQYQLEKKFPRIGLIIVGDGSYRADLEKLALELNLDNVEFVGRKVDDSYMYFAVADVFVLPGLGGLAISEAMCYGLPVIVSIGDGCEVDLVTPENGIIDKDITAQSLASHIATLYRNPTLRESLGERSSQIIKEKYNIHGYLSKIKDAIKS